MGAFRRSEGSEGGEGGEDDEVHTITPQMERMANKYGLIHRHAPAILAHSSSTNPLSSSSDHQRRLSRSSRWDQNQKQKQLQNSRSSHWEKHNRSRSRSPSRSRSRERDSKNGENRERRRSRTPPPRNGLKHQNGRTRYGNGYVYGYGYGKFQAKKATEPITEEERKKRIAMMMSDAEKHDQDALNRLSESKVIDEAEKSALNQRPSSPTHAPLFLQRANQNIYSGNETVGERINKFRNNRQRGNIDQQSFLKSD